MTSFESDYNNGAHPAVLKHLIETNDQQSQSYGFDQWSESAREKIRQACQCPQADIFFLAGGTQTNATVIDATVANYEGVLATTTAHINVHESGAVEAFGHKVITLPSHNGRMSAIDLISFLRAFYDDPTYEHMVLPGMVYITFPTELGTLYTAEEIEHIYKICKGYNLRLFIDGARLGYGLASDECDFDLAWLAAHCDVFSIGGTKMGALCGEAVVFPQGNAPRHFLNIVKRHGALLAKSRVAGVQFDALFTDGLYMQIGRHAIEMAMRMQRIFAKHGIKLSQSSTNQQFAELTQRQMDELSQYVSFETWEPIDSEITLCRFVTSWATTDAHLDTLRKALEKMSRETDRGAM